MEKTLLVDLKRKMFIRSSLISLSGLDELLGLNDYLSADEIILEIIKKALREFENTCPLILEMPINKAQLGTCFGREGYGEVKSNFTLFLNCVIPEHRIILVPNSIPMWRIGGGGNSGSYTALGGTSSYPQALAYEYVLDYIRPYIFVANLPTDEFYLRGICSRPITPDWISEKDKTFNPKSETSAVWWMNIEDGGAKGNYFLDLCMVHLLDFIRQLKASISLPNMSIDILANIDSAYQELRSRCDQYALQSGWYGELIL